MSVKQVENWIRPSWAVQSKPGACHLLHARCTAVTVGLLRFVPVTRFDAFPQTEHERTLLLDFYTSSYPAGKECLFYRNSVLFNGIYPLNRKSSVGVVEFYCLGTLIFGRFCDYIDNIGERGFHNALLNFSA